MGAATELRKQIESALAGRIPAALSPRPLRSPELVSCGVAEVDALLGGGWPLGSIIELTPPQHANSRRAGDPVWAGASGRTTLALSTLAGLTRQGHCCAYVDACDALDPLSAAALGVELRRLLWVRPPAQKVTHICPPFSSPRQRRKNSGAGRGAPWVRSKQSPPSDSYQRLDRALRATDLLLNAGGWGAVVLDLAGLGAAQARRVPLATWYRFRLQAEKSRALLLLLTPVACASTGAPGEPSVGLPRLSCAAVSLHSEEMRAEWRRAVEIASASQPMACREPRPGPALLAELHHRVSLSRSRVGNPVPKKPPASHATQIERDRNARDTGKDPHLPTTADVRHQKMWADQTWWTSALSWPG